MTAEQQDRKDWLTPEQVAAELPGVTAWWVRRELVAGRLVGSKPGRRWFVHRDSLAAFMAANSNDIKQPTTRRRRKRAS